MKHIDIIDVAYNIANGSLLFRRYKRFKAPKGLSIKKLKYYAKQNPLLKPT